MMAGILEGKNIVVIGGSAGIGLSAVKAFLREGARVVAIGLDTASCLQAASELPSPQVIFLPGDARNASTADLAIRRCIEVYGDFDALYHVAGGSGRKRGDGPLHKMSLEGWHYTLDLNLTSVMLSNQAALRHFLQMEKKGAILNVGSVLASSPAPAFFTTHAYAAAKSAIIGFSRSLAAYYAPYNIRINVLTPALTQTPMAQRASMDPQIMAYIQTKQPLDGGRIGDPADLDAMAVLCLSDQARFMTGQVIAIDGGWQLSEGQIPPE